MGSSNPYSVSSPTSREIENFISREGDRFLCSRAPCWAAYVEKMNLRESREFYEFLRYFRAPESERVQRKTCAECGKEIGASSPSKKESRRVQLNSVGPLLSSQIKTVTEYLGTPDSREVACSPGCARALIRSLDGGTFVEQLDWDTALLYEKCLSSGGDPVAMLREIGRKTGTCLGCLTPKKRDKFPMSRTPEKLSSVLAPAGYRIAGRQLVRAVQEPLAALAARHLPEGSDAFRGRVSRFLAGDVGRTLVNSVLAVGVSSLPFEREFLRGLARELRESAFASGADMLAELVTDPLRKVLAGAIRDGSGSPTRERPEIPAARVPAPPPLPGERAETEAPFEVKDMRSTPR